MDETLHQLEGLLLGSVPTIFLFLLIVILYRLLVYGPLTRVLNERRERTEGAIEQANAAMAAAAAKTQEYEAQLRAARSRIFQARQQSSNSGPGNETTRLRKPTRLPSARSKRPKRPCRHKPTPATRTIEDSIDELASEILAAVLPKSRAAVGRVR